MEFLMISKVIKESFLQMVMNYITEREIQLKK